MALVILRLSALLEAASPVDPALTDMASVAPVCSQAYHK